MRWQYIGGWSNLEIEELESILKGNSHKTGGTYCKASWQGDKTLIGGCLCNQPTPINEVR